MAGVFGASLRYDSSVETVTSDRKEHQVEHDERDEWDDEAPQGGAYWVALWEGEARA